MTIKIKRYLQTSYPEIADQLRKTETIPKLKRRDVLLPEAVVRVVVGQMLSSKAADTIYSRVKQQSVEKNLSGSWLLEHRSLRSCGLSNSKARTICEFGARLGDDPGALDYWYSLPPIELMNEIKCYRGMGEWTAGILALFYVGHENVFPAGDGSLARAIDLIQQASGKEKAKPFDVEKASPYRSYLALYLWQLLDTGAFSK